MAKAIYALKIFLFRKQFLKANEITKLRKFCIFVLLYYIKFWFRAPKAASAPRNDLDFIKNLSKDYLVRTDMCKLALDKFKNHLWYLGEELICLAFFDKKVPIECKNKMRDAFKNNESCGESLKASFKNTLYENLQNLTLDKFVTKSSFQFFKKLSLDYTFLDFDANTWEERLEYQAAFEIVNCLEVVNDRAERAVSVIKNYNLYSVKNETSKQQMLKVISKHIEMSKSVTKTDLEKKFVEYYNTY